MCLYFNKKLTKYSVMQSILHNVQSSYEAVNYSLNEIVDSINMAATAYLLFKYNFSKTAVGSLVFKSANVPGRIESILKSNGEAKIKYKVYRPKMQIKTIGKAVEVFRSIWDKNLLEVQEHVYVIFLSIDDRMICWKCICKGSHKACIFDVRMILAIALNCNAYKVIVAHNHPCGSLYPSAADERITDKLNVAFLSADVDLLDHIILTKAGYYSFREHDNVLS